MLLTFQSLGMQTTHVDHVTDIKGWQTDALVGHKDAQCIKCWDQSGKRRQIGLLCCLEIHGLPTFQYT